MKRLYAPWRSHYAKSIMAGKHADAAANTCDFCTQLAANNDEKYFILKRFNHSFVCLNLYPYNAGHLLVLPLTHTATLHQLTPEARTEIMEVVSLSTQIAEQVLQCNGINVGINLGKAAGAGIPHHLHVHVLPRFNGDTNFMPILSDTKLISFDLQELYTKLKPAFTKN